MNALNQIFEVRNSAGKLIAIFRPKAIMVASKPAKKAKASIKLDKVAVHVGLRARWDKEKETVSYNYNAEVNLTKQEIRIYGTDNDRPFDRSFKVGDKIETGSYNLVYTNPIEGFTANNIIANYYGGKRINLHEFIRRNWDLDLECIAKRNSEWYD